MFRWTGLTAGPILGLLILLLGIKINWKIKKHGIMNYSQNPKVSIVTVCFNSSKFIQKILILSINNHMGN